MFNKKFKDKTYHKYKKTKKQQQKNGISNVILRRI